MTCEYALGIWSPPLDSGLYIWTLLPFFAVSLLFPASFFLADGTTLTFESHSGFPYELIVGAWF